MSRRAESRFVLNPVTSFVTLVVTPLSAILLGGCALSRQEPPPNLSPAQLAGGAWQVAQMDGTDAVESGKTWIRFESEGRVAGSGGCNQFSGPLKRSGATIAIGPAVSTKRYCLGPIQLQEDRFYRLLEEVRNAHLEGNELVMTDTAGKSLMRLVKKD